MCWFVCLFVARTTVHVQRTHSVVVRIYKRLMCICWFVCNNATGAYTSCACASRRVRRHCGCAEPRKKMRNKVATQTLLMRQTPRKIAFVHPFSHLSKPCSNRFFYIIVIFYVSTHAHQIKYFYVQTSYK